MKVFGGHWGLKHPEDSISNILQYVLEFLEHFQPYKL